MKIKLSLYLCLILVLLAGCNQEKGRIKDTVIKYNTLLADGYKNLNMTPLLQVATEEQSLKAYYHMAALGEARIKMDAKLRSINFLDIKSLSQKSEVRTEEMWDYTHINIDTGQSVFHRTISYRIRYLLIKRSERWFVSDVTVEEESIGY